MNSIPIYIYSAISMCSPHPLFFPKGLLHTRAFLYSTIRWLGTGDHYLSTSNLFHFRSVNFLTITSWYSWVSR